MLKRNLEEILQRVKKSAVESIQDPKKEKKRVG